MANAIMVIVPYRHAGTWVFDDERVGLVKEPFVLGIPPMIDRLLEQAGMAGVERFRMLFSASRFPGHQAAIEWVRGEFGGNWYRWTEAGLDGWLCPALFHYFRDPPPHLYVRLEVI